MTRTLQKKPRMALYDEPYWGFVQKGELRLQKCSACGAVRYPPSPTCAKCLSPDHEWHVLSGRARLVSWARFHRQYLPEFPVPYVIVSVETEEGSLLIGQLRDAEGTQLTVGMKMEPVFETIDTVDGPFRICQWKPSNDFSDLR
jgi:uncharacterized protein